MADAGGIEQAFRAWQDRFHSDHEGKTFANYLLPGIEYTREQLFFIAYAQGWRRNIKPAEAVKRIRTDPHSPTNFRGECAPDRAVPGARARERERWQRSVLMANRRALCVTFPRSDWTLVEQCRVQQGVRVQGWTTHEQREEVSRELSRGESQKLLSGSPL